MFTNKALAVRLTASRCYINLNFSLWHCKLNAIVNY